MLSICDKIKDMKLHPSLNYMFVSESFRKTICSATLSAFCN